MTNTLNNVPRELLENTLNKMSIVWQSTDEMDQLRALLSAPSPAGVDGMEVAATYVQEFMRAVPSGLCHITDGDQLCRLSDVKAIIDGLRGENQRLQQELRLHQSQIESSGRIADRAQRVAVQLRTERDQQAQRIGELEGLLRAESARVDFLDAHILTADAPNTGKVAMLADSGTLRECIDAALSAGKEGE